MNNYLIVADDFTGANDTGVQLVNHGINVNVNFDISEMSASNINSSSVIDTETRNISETKASKRMYSMMSKINFDQFDVIMKKVDSTLRGNISAEVRVLANLYKPDLVVFAPSLPSLGRVVRDKHLYIDGMRAVDTEIGKDPLKPIKSDDINQILSKAFVSNNVSHFTLNQIRSKDFVIDDNEKIMSFDAETSMDFKKIIQSAKETNRKILWIGSAGLMSNLLLEYEKVLPAIGLVGSVSDVTRKQLYFAKKNGIPLINIPIYDVYQNDSYEKYLTEAEKFLEEGSDVIVMSSASFDRSELKKTINKLEKNYGFTPEKVSKLTQTILAGICRRLILKNKSAGVFVTGGDTAKGLLTVGKATGVKVISEIEPGIPLLKIKSGDLDGINIVTKAGAFGNEDLILYAFKKLRTVCLKKE